MYPTLKDKNLVFVKKNNLELKNNDIVIVKKDGKTIIKRLVGLPNDRIKIDKYLYVNGKKNDDFYTENCGTINEEIQLKSNKYFVLGDNRQNSIDSRNEEIGLINKEDIIGKIIFFKKGEL